MLTCKGSVTSGLNKVYDCVRLMLTGFRAKISRTATQRHNKKCILPQEKTEHHDALGAIAFTQEVWR